MPVIARVLLCFALVLPVGAQALAPPCNGGRVFEDRDGDGRWSRGDRPLPGVLVSDGLQLVRSDARGGYTLPWDDGRTTFVVKPAGYAFPTGADGLPVFWRHQQYHPGPALAFGGIPAASPDCRDFALVRGKPSRAPLDVLVFADPQAKTAVQVDYYDRDIIAPLVAAANGRPAAALGLTLGDVANDDLSLYPALKAATARLRTPWLHAAGNHDLDFDAATDEESLRSFRHAFGPDTFAWEEHQASFIVLDDVIYRPGQKPAYIGGLREDQFTWLAAYLDTLPRDRRLVIAAHIPFFDEPGRETFRRADRERLFALLAPFGKVLLLSGHGHVQRHHYHDADDGWHGAEPLHEYNVGAACGGYWGGAPDAEGLPDARMSDGTPNGYARRINGGDWQPMRRVDAPDPALVAENVLDDLANALRGYDRLPEAEASTHLWRFNLPTDLPPGEHGFEVRAFDRWRGELRASGSYRLVEAAE